MLLFFNVYDEMYDGEFFERIMLEKSARNIYVIIFEFIILSEDKIYREKFKSLHKLT
jgi:hypothetical protein